MYEQNEAQRILAALGVYNAFGIIRRYRYATQEREKHRNKAGTYGRGLRNWINRKASAAAAQSMGRKIGR